MSSSSFTNHHHNPTSLGTTNEGSGVSGHSFLSSVHNGFPTAPVVVLRHHSPNDRCVMLDLFATMDAATTAFSLMDTDQLAQHASSVRAHSSSPLSHPNGAGLPDTPQCTSPLHLEDGCSLSLCLGTAHHDNVTSAAHVVAHRSAVEAEVMFRACVYFLVSTHIEDRGGDSACTTLGQRTGSIVTGVYCTRKEPVASGAVAGPRSDLPRGCTQSTFTFGLITRAPKEDARVDKWVSEWVSHLDLRLKLHQLDAQKALFILMTPDLSAPWRSTRDRKHTGFGIMGRSESREREAELRPLEATLRLLADTAPSACHVMPFLPVPFCATLRSNRLTMFWDRCHLQITPNMVLPEMSLIFTSSTNVAYHDDCLEGRGDTALDPPCVSTARGAHHNPHFSEVYWTARIGLLRPAEESIVGNSVYLFDQQSILDGRVRDAVRDESNGVRRAMMGMEVGDASWMKKAPSFGNPSRSTTITRGVTPSPEPHPHGSSSSPRSSSLEEGTLPIRLSPSVVMMYTPRSGTATPPISGSPLPDRWSNEALHGVSLGCSPPGHPRHHPSQSSSLPPTIHLNSNNNHKAPRCTAPTRDAAALGPQWRAVKPATRKVTFTGLSFRSAGRHVLSGYMGPSFLYEPFVAPLTTHIPPFVVGAVE